MRFGTFQLHSVPEWSNSYDAAQQQFDQMLAAEQNGFSELWLAEHNGRDYGMVGNVVTVAAALAAATKRIRIATAVSRLPLHHPLHLAEDLAYVDVLSGGRVDFGVGRGYDKLEFETYGVPFEERDERWEETLTAVRRLWNTGSTEFDGKFHKLGAGAMMPATLQPGGPPVYVMVSGSERSIGFAAQNLLPMALGSGRTPGEVRASLNNFVEQATEAGHPDEGIAACLEASWQLKPVHVARTTEAAIAGYRRGLEWYMAELNNRSQAGFARDASNPYSYYVEHEAVVLGSEEHVTERLAHYCEVSGLSNVICWINMGGQPHAQVMDCLERMGQTVIPQLAGVSHDWSGLATDVSGRQPASVAS